ncbi:MAG TPA: acyl carrier protein [Planctomycetaceae bacterium]
MEISESILMDVRRLVAENLQHNIEDVRPEASFFGELEGESLDMLDLKFRLEKMYGVRIQVQDLDYQLDDRGCLTPESLSLLKSNYQFLKLDGFESRPMQRRGEFLTVEAIAGFVQMAVDGKSVTTPG